MTVTRGQGDEIPYAEPGRRGGDIGNGGQQVLVVGVDGTVAGVAALRWAVDQAGRTGGRVLAIAVSEPPPPLVAGGPEVAAGVLVQNMPDDDELAAAADRWLTDAVSALPAGTGQVVERRAVVRGDAATVLLETARDADLLVLGNHGRGALAGALVGSVAQHCVHHAGCPLVLVPAPKPPESG